MRYDVWWCPECVVHYWTCPSVPHRNECPECKRSGWWLRFTSSPTGQVLPVTFPVLDLDQPWIEEAITWAVSLS